MQYSLRTPGLEELPRAQYASYFQTARVLLERGAELTGVQWTLPIEQLARILIAITDVSLTGSSHTLLPRKRTHR